jgi:hypothetical protein
MSSTFRRGDAGGDSELFLDTLTNISATMTDLKNSALVPLMQAIQPVIESVQEWAAENRELIGAKVAGFIDGVRDAVKRGVEIFRENKPEILSASCVRKRSRSSKMTSAASERVLGKVGAILEVAQTRLSDVQRAATEKEVSL